MSKHLHIVSFDVPYPADYGGVIDVFYKLKALSESGIKIHLHCYSKGRPEAAILENYCSSVSYYPRREKIPGIHRRLPYIVSSRQSMELTRKLLEDDYPILLEGLHCSNILNLPELKERKIILRQHNVEFQYYRNLALYEPNPFKKIYYRIESRLLEHYEQRIAAKLNILPLSFADAEIFRTKFNEHVHDVVPAFIPWQEVRSKEGTGSYLLYHGNLAVNENAKAGAWIITDIIAGIEMPLVIAGANPPAWLIALANKNAKVKLIQNPAEREMEDLIEEAHINIIPAFNNTGVKIKLLNALFNGRHCVVNLPAVAGSGLEDLCRIASSAEEFRQVIRSLSGVPFDEAGIKKRSALLQTLYNNHLNAGMISSWIP